MVNRMTFTLFRLQDYFVVSTSDEHSVSLFRDGTSLTWWHIGAGTATVKSLILNVPESIQDGTAVPITIVGEYAIVW